MAQYSFSDYASTENHPQWDKHIERMQPLYSRENDIRTAYERDYTRILHSLAYRRLKHKTQVFFNIDNDHICTRMEHVQHVESVSCTIAQYLGLNTDLTRAIAMGHDLGHSPFGHEGENALSKMGEKVLLPRFWHEKNSLRMIDALELLSDVKNNYENLNLTYAVRDGIISHCGELDENGIRPREEAIDLSTFSTSGQYQAYTWEGCVVKVSDKIAYIGRDIEDALRLGFISEEKKKELERLAQKYDVEAINTTVLIHKLISDICANSSPQDGICLSENHCRMMNEIKMFNGEAIYKNPRFNAYKGYVDLVLNSLFDTLLTFYAGDETLVELNRDQKVYPHLITDFVSHLSLYSELCLPEFEEEKQRYRNAKIYGRLETKQIYGQAIIDYISGMTDRYAIAMFEELLRY